MAFLPPVKDGDNGGPGLVRRVNATRSLEAVINLNVVQLAPSPWSIARAKEAKHKPHHAERVTSKEMPPGHSFD